MISIPIDATHSTASRLSSGVIFSKFPAVRCTVSRTPSTRTTSHSLERKVRWVDCRFSTGFSNWFSPFDSWQTDKVSCPFRDKSCGKPKPIWHLERHIAQHHLEQGKWLAKIHSDLLIGQFMCSQSQVPQLHPSHASERNTEHRRQKFSTRQQGHDSDNGPSPRSAQILHWRGLSECLCREGDERPGRPIHRSSRLRTVEGKTEERGRNRAISLRQYSACFGAIHRISV